MRVEARRLLTRHPADVEELRALIEAGEVDPGAVRCIIGKTEGNGGRNDFTRALAMSAFEGLFGPALGVPAEQVQDRVIFSLSGGTEGVVSPHVIVFSVHGELTAARQPHKRLVMGTGYTRVFQPEEIGRMAQIEETARVVRELMAELRIDSPEDVHLVQMKGAIPTADYERRRAAARAGTPIRSDMVHSRGASALGVALGLGEVAERDLSDEVVCRDWALHSSVASCSAKPGLERTELMLFANSAHATGDLAMGHGNLADMIDADGVRAVLRSLGFSDRPQLSAAEREALVGVFAKSEADPRGQIRGKRHTMLRDDDISDTRHSRCVLSSVLASVTGDTAVYVSTRAEHHGPVGGGTLSILADLSKLSNT